MSQEIKQNLLKDIFPPPGFCNKDTEKNIINDDLDDWFNDLDDRMIEIINKDLIKEEPQENEETEITQDNNNNISTETEYIYVEDILTKDLDKLSSNELIQYECSIAYFIQVLIEGSNINKIKSIKTYDNELSKDKIKDIILYLKWISKTSEILAKRIKQEILPFIPSVKPIIVRSSYNFCTKYTQCKNFYSKHEEPSCKEHHYVHSLLKYDIDSVISFLEYIVDNNIILEKDELNNLYLSIKTICFVTRHMSKEISYIDYITKNNSENFHRNNPIDLSKKKSIFKTPDNKTLFNQNLRQYNNHNISNNADRYNNRQAIPKYRSNKPRYNDTRQNGQDGFKKSSLLSINKSTNYNPTAIKNTKTNFDTNHNEKNINRYSVLSNF